MAVKPAQTKTVKNKRGDTEVKGRKQSGSKRTSIGKSRNSKPKNRDAVRNRKGR